MNANWSGLVSKHPLVEAALEKVLARLAKSSSGNQAAAWYAVFTTGPGIIGLGNNKPDVNGGVNHFGSPFNFPEEFVTVYRLHSMVPDLIEFRELRTDPNTIRYKIPVVETLQAKATQAVHRYGLADWALSMGRQRLGKLTLQNHPLFLQSLSIPRLQSATGKIDVPALDIIRDRERGVPRYNEFRRQYGLKQLTSFDESDSGRLSAFYGKSTGNTSARIQKSSPRRRSRVTAPRSPIVSAIQTAAWWTISRTWTQWSVG